MSTTLEVKYFNTFWIKKMKAVVEGTPTTPTTPYNNVPRSYATSTGGDWYIEESRIRGGYNNLSVDFGVKAYIVEEHPEQQDRINTMIYSGIFNSRTGVNNTNQFSVAESITRSVDPANGSIQRLYAEDTNLIIFQQDKVSKALIDKDAIYSAEGSASITSTREVIGQVIAFPGEYGISDDPFSFAVYGYRKYFTDRKRNAVLRLDTNGSITEISSFGMHDYFRDKLSATSNEGISIVDKIRGGFDFHTKNYILSIQNTDNTYTTVNFDEDVKGWTSFFDYKPTFMTSLNSSFYSFNSGKIWKHHAASEAGVTGYGNFYTVVYNSDVSLILNSQPSTVKNFKTIGYEGAIGWEMQSMVASSSDASLPITAYTSPSSTNLHTLAALEENIFTLNFKRKENKFFANLQQQLKGPTTTATTLGPAPGEVLWGSYVSGIKGFWATVKMKINNTTFKLDKKELFAVSSDIDESSY